MAKSRKTKSSVFKTITSAPGKALPLVNSGFNTVGNVAKDVAETSIPVIQTGVSTVYGTMANGFDLGIKGVKTVARGVNLNTKKRHSRRNKRTRRNKHSSKYRNKRRY
jgi:hypothetical protein